jgi:hypothetical protein
VPRAHVVIAGTGRAGTSFLVRFLAACGLDVGPTTEYEYERARAGLEHRVLDVHAPYVVKDPWFFVYCERIDPAVVSIDALIVPVRELVAAATSRVVQELMARPDEIWRDWPPADVYAATPGGVVYSVDPVDQARLLAVGFHRLIYWATVRQIPILLIAFPRCVSDREYLIDNLWPWLGAHCERERARQAFDAVTEPELVRAEGWMQRETSELDAVQRTEGPSVESLEREALTEMLLERAAHIEALNTKLAKTTAELNRAYERIAQIKRDRSQGARALAEALRQRDEAAARLAKASSLVRALRATFSWRITRPLRTARSLASRLDKRGD